MMARTTLLLPCKVVLTFVIALFVCLPVPAAAQLELESISVTIPSSISFDVDDVTTATIGAPDPFTISFNTILIVPLHRVKVSVKANTSGFTPPSGTAIPAANVSWTITGATGGSGSSGTLSSSAFTQVYLSNTLPSSGSVGLKWSLAAPGTGIRAGNHNLTVTWKLEAL